MNLCPVCLGLEFSFAVYQQAQTQEKKYMDEINTAAGQDQEGSGRLNLAGGKASCFNTNVHFVESERFLQSLICQVRNAMYVFIFLKQKDYFQNILKAPYHGHYQM